MSEARTIRHELLALASDIRAGIEAFRKACEKLDNLLQGEADNLSIAAADESTRPTVVGRYREAVKDSPMDRLVRQQNLVGLFQIMSSNPAMMDVKGEASKPRKPRKPMSEESRAKLAENLKKARAARRPKA